MYDVIVIGGGHAGIEASLAAARMQASVLLLTQNVDHIGQMSCNPAIGGIAKGHVVREIDALGGQMAINTDATSIQFRMLNHSKGPAVWSPRAQCDKVLYQRRMKQVLEKNPRIHIQQAEGLSFKTKNNKITHVITQFGEVYQAQSFVLCCGTFMRGLIHFGDKSFAGGRTGDAAADSISLSLKNDLKLNLLRLKTGTPPRVLSSSIDFSKLEEQESSQIANFSFWQKSKLASIDRGSVPQLSCFITYTNEKTQQVIEDNILKSPMYNGTIEAIGTRYCPSIEDKIHRFPDKNRHQIFLEPEGAFTEEYYLNGISTCLPIDIQHKMINSIQGLENAKITRYAYAVEYDVISPEHLQNDLSIKNWENLFSAGQINGTSGYEEAAGQGLIAGANATNYAKNTPKLILQRNEAYIGVMIDDLTTKEITEPYRLFTSRAEYRLLLRQDNADRRLAKIAYNQGLLSFDKYQIVQDKEAQITKEKQILQNTKKHGKSLWQLLQNPQTSYDELIGENSLNMEVKRQLEIDAQYESYIKREQQIAQQLQKLDYIKIPKDFNYNINGLKKEAITKLTKLNPANLGQASRIDGVTPAQISVLQIYLKKTCKKNTSKALKDIK